MWDILHFVTAVPWLGVALCQLTLNVVAATGSPEFPAVVYQIAHDFDLYLLFPLALGALVTGIVRALRFRWGLLQYWWIAVKLGLTIVLMVFDSIWVGEWNVRAGRLAAASDHAAYVALLPQLLVGSLLNMSLLAFMVVVSVIKPWGRTPWSPPRQRLRNREAEPRRGPTTSS